MSDKRLKTRVFLKHETEADWLQSSFVPQLGEVVIYDPDNTHATARFKLGDGITNVNNLPFQIHY